MGRVVSIANWGKQTFRSLEMWNRTRIALAMVGVLGLFTSAAQAAFVLVSDLDTVDNWSPSVNGAIPTGSDLAHRFIGSGADNLHFPTAIADSSVGTVFFELYTTGVDLNQLLRFDTAASVGGDFNNSAVYIAPRAADGVVSVSTGTGGGNATETTSGAVNWKLNDWNPFWVVLDLNDSAGFPGTYQIWVGDSNGPADFTGLFRDNVDSFGAIEYLKFKGFSGGELDIDNVYVDTTGFNLASPIPEPAGITVLGVVLGMAARRRKRTAR